MIETGYIYLCPADKLGNQFEGMFNFEDYIDNDHSKLYEDVPIILKSLGINTPTSFNIEDFFKDEKIDYDYVIDYLEKNKQEFDPLTIKSFLNEVNNAPQKIFKLEMKEKLERIVLSK